MPGNTEKTTRIAEAAQRALAEAKERRSTERKENPEKELGGRKGPDPVRYGDWEKKGIAVDF